MTVLRRSRKISFVRQIVLQLDALETFTPYDRQIKQTVATCLEKLVQRNHNIIFD